MYEVTVEVTFDAAHRLLCYEGKCHSLHGHSYVAIVCIDSEELGPSHSGFVMDFGVLKKIVKGWIDKNWDHRTLLNRSDPLGALLEDEGCNIFLLDFDPTAEHMARYLYRTLCSALHHRKALRVAYVTIKETQTSWATYMPDKEK